MPYTSSASRSDSDSGTEKQNSAIEEKLESLVLQRAEGLLLVSNTPKGRGIFASKPIPKGTIIEISPVLLVSPEEVSKHTRHTVLEHYTYNWPCPSGDGSQTQAVALGLGSMFNHSTLHQNVVWSRNVDAEVIVYTAHRDIPAGDELCISYGSGRLWFPDADFEAEIQEAEKVKASSELVGSGLGAITVIDADST